MKVLIRLAVLAAGVAASSQAIAGAPLLSALQGAPGCGHVLDLLTRYGGLEGLPIPGGAAAIPSPMGGGLLMPIAELGDLCIATVEELPTDAGCLPTIVVGVTNHSTRPICNAHVSVVALLGPIKLCDPTANVCLDEIPAGATVEVEITLPAEALAMGSNGGVPVGFQRLLVAIDSLDAFAELDEANNLRLLCRADIPQRVAVTTEAATLDPAAEVPVAPAPEADVDRPALDQALERFGLEVSAADTTAERL